MAYATIDKGSKYFNTVTYTGDGASPKSITGVGFKPDFVWSKSRSTAENHNLYDAVRGGTQGLRSNSDAIETSSNIYGYVSTFNSDGVTYISGGTNNDLNNGNGVTFVNWNWLGANTTVSNTSGTITSTVSANTTSGFSIVSYTGNGTNNATVGHGLGVTPAMLIVKNRDVADGWGVWNKGLGSATQQMQLNGTSAVFTDDVFNAVSSTTVTLGTDSWSNTSTKNYIMYCWSEVKGFSKFGSYTGNGSTDGTFVYTGFKPSFIMVKETGNVNSWRMLDNKRSPINVMNKPLFANLSNAEGSADHETDFVSNGFKIRSSDTNMNRSGGTFIYMAFAENPFVSSKGIPTTAR
jgi:hypothetical protein